MPRVPPVTNATRAMSNPSLNLPCPRDLMSSARFEGVVV
jgi:hypothetical protein